MIIRLFRRFSSNDNGATALEYGLLAGLISIMVIAGATTAGTALDGIFTYVGDQLTTAVPAAPAAPAP